jgi:uncharacterized membrane protein
MPVSLIDTNQKAPVKSGAFSHADGDAPALRLMLWPHRSLPARGFVGFIGITCALIALPLLGVLGTPVLWGVLPFFALAVGGVWLALRRSYHDGRLTEEFTLWSDRVTLVRINPRGQRQSWEANPHWVRVALRETGGPVENYLTLKGGGREVEIGAFLSPDERLDLRATLERALARA